MQVFVVEHLLKDKAINLPFIMLSYMDEQHGHQKNLLYCLLFTWIFRHFGATRDNRERDTLAKSKVLILRLTWLIRLRLVLLPKQIHMV